MGVWCGNIGTLDGVHGELKVRGVFCDLKMAVQSVYKKLHLKFLHLFFPPSNLE